VSPDIGDFFIVAVIFVSLRMASVFINERNDGALRDASNVPLKRAQQTLRFPPSRSPPRLPARLLPRSARLSAPPSSFEAKEGVSLKGMVAVI